MAPNTVLTRQFEDRVAVVTGATQGLGEITARLLAERGAAGLVVCGRNTARGEALADDLSTGGCPTRFVRCDLARVEDCRALMAATDSAFGTLHALVNCAGLSERGTLLDTTPELFDRIFAVNVRAPFFLMQEAARIMRREGMAGTMVNIISVCSHGGQPYLSAYSASKGALATLTRNTAHALLPDRIRVNGLNIGWMNTPGEDAVQRQHHGATDGWLEAAAGRQPFGRLLDPEEVARAVAYLCSDESGLMTGALIDFDQAVVGASG